MCVNRGRACEIEMDAVEYQGKGEVKLDVREDDPLRKTVAGFEFGHCARYDGEACLLSSLSKEKDVVPTLSFDKWILWSVSTTDTKATSKITPRKKYPNLAYTEAPPNSSRYSAIPRACMPL